MATQVPEKSGQPEGVEPEGRNDATTRKHDDSNASIWSPCV